MKKTCDPIRTPPATRRSRPAHRRRPALLRLLCGLLLPTACLPTAMASGDTAELRVVGRILPGACTVELGNSGNVDFGNITAAQIQGNEGARHLLGERTLSFSIQCLPANSPRFSIKDHRTDSLPAIWHRLSNDAARAKMFGLGRAEDKNIGMYLVHFRGIRADGENARLVRSADGEAPWQFIEQDEVLTKEHKYVWSTTSQPEAGWFSAVNGDIVVKLWPEPLSELPSGGDIRLDGSATLDLEYP